MPQIIITIVFGFLWWWVYNRVGAGLTYLMILGSVLAVCVCCCKGGEPQWGWWNFNWGQLPCLHRAVLLANARADNRARRHRHSGGALHDRRVSDRRRVDEHPARGDFRAFVCAHHLLRLGMR
jgi:hypothetical protein